MGDAIESIRILSGEENLVRKQDPAPPSVVEVAAAEAPAVAAASKVVSACARARLGGAEGWTFK